MVRAIILRSIYRTVNIYLFLRFFLPGTSLNAFETMMPLLLYRILFVVLLIWFRPMPVDALYVLVVGSKVVLQFGVNFLKALHKNREILLYVFLEFFGSYSLSRYNSLILLIRTLWQSKLMLLGFRVRWLRSCLAYSFEILLSQKRYYIGRSYDTNPRSSTWIYSPWWSSSLLQLRKAYHPTTTDPKIWWQSVCTLLFNLDDIKQ